MRLLLYTFEIMVMFQWGSFLRISTLVSPLEPINNTSFEITRQARREELVVLRLC